MEKALMRKRAHRLGKGFSDSIQARLLGFFFNPMSPYAHGVLARQRGEGDFHPGARVPTFILLSFGFLVFLAIRLFVLTVVRGSYYHSLSEGNRSREERIPPNRGVIYDRHGAMLAGNAPVYQVFREDGALQIISREESLARESRGEDLLISLSRFYPEASTAAHVVGYTGQASKEFLAERNQGLRAISDSRSVQFCQLCYASGDMVGITGAEQAFKGMLRGTPGKHLVEVDAYGTVVRELAKVAPVAGENVKLSLDLRVQRVVVEALQDAISASSGRGGVVIASKPNSGEVVALYSYTSFDPSLFVSKIADPAHIQALLTDASSPLFNRAVSGLYPPSSTFKIVTASAGLEQGAIKETTTVEDTGVLTVGAFPYTNWYFTQYGRTEGEIAVVRAIARSNDIFFYKTGEWTGADVLEQWARRFGSGAPLGIELSGETAGVVRRDRRWYLGDTYHFAIGQADMSVTPLQVNAWSQVIANDGVLCVPTILKSDNSTAQCKNIGLSQETVRLVKTGMQQACAEGGTGWPLFKFKVQSSGINKELTGKTLYRRVMVG